MKLRGESGQVAVLVLGFAIVVMAVVGLAVDGTKAFLYRRTLQSAADGAAVAGASELDLDSYYSSGGRVVAIAPGAARLQALRLLDSRAIRTTVAVDATEDAVSVVIRGRVETTFLNLVGVSAIPVAVEAVAEPFAGES
ncbi:MAG TPA: pilus assembly protein TadG-related protein [Actinomycetota bacterium]|nr:pilus assembly protein TadG-related protein [Actinomycetota bacterium]